jgi:hypothetical protein
MKSIRATKKISTLLVRRPTPKCDEGIRGYALRVDYENTVGLFRPRMGSLRSARLSLVDLAATTGKEIKVSQNGIFVKGKHQKQLTYQYDFKYSVPPQWICDNHKRICPYCLAEDGFMQGIWEIKVIDSCLVHECYLVDYCSSCDRQLYWTGGSLMECVCRAPLCEIGTVTVGSNRRSLDKFLMDRLHSMATDEIEPSTSSVKHNFSIAIDHCFSELAITSFHIARQNFQGLPFKHRQSQSEHLARFALRLIELGRPMIESLLYKLLGRQLNAFHSSYQVLLMFQDADCRHKLLKQIFNLEQLYSDSPYIHNVLLPAWDEAHYKWQKTVDQSQIDLLNSLDPLTVAAYIRKAHLSISLLR